MAKKDFTQSPAGTQKQTPEMHGNTAADPVANTTQEFFWDRPWKIDEFAELTEEGVNPDHAEKIRRIHKSLYAIQTLTNIKMQFEVEDSFHRDGQPSSSRITDHGHSQLLSAIRLLAEYSSSDVYDLAHSLKHHAKEGSK